MKTVTFYHSMVCPRCQMAGHSLSQLLDEFPDLSVEKVEFLTNKREAKEADVRSIPAMVCGDQRIGGVYLTKRKIRGFLASL